jgi:hypothetical protein
VDQHHIPSHKVTRIVNADATVAERADSIDTGGFTFRRHLE